MQRLYLAAGAALMSVAMIGCSKPASEAASDAGSAATVAANDAGMAASNASDSMAAATSDAGGSGGAVSPPAPNEAVDTNANADPAGPTAASNSFTEGQARGHIEKAGYTEVAELTKTPEGLWTAKAKKGGKVMDVALDFKGAVTAK